MDAVHTAIAVVPYKKVSNRKQIPFQFVAVESKDRRKGAKTHCGVVAGKAAMTLQAQKESGRVACKARKSASSRKNDSRWQGR